MTSTGVRFVCPNQRSAVLESERKINIYYLQRIVYKGPTISKVKYVYIYVYSYTSYMDTKKLYNDNEHKYIFG